MFPHADKLTNLNSFNKSCTEGSKIACLRCLCRATFYCAACIVHVGRLAKGLCADANEATRI